MPGSTTPLPFDKAGYLNLHRDLESALGLDNLVTPSEVQKDSRSLRERITTVGWPDLSEMRGRFIFLIDEPLKKTAGYLEDFEKHERLLFLSVPSDHDQAAILVMNDPLKAFDDITARVAKGFLVRTERTLIQLRRAAPMTLACAPLSLRARTLSAPITMCGMRDLRAIIGSVSQKAGMLANRRAPK